MSNQCSVCYGKAYPIYGLAPHRHNAVLGNEGFKEKEKWPDNFEPDLDEDGTEMPIGVWYCPVEGCENSKKSYETALFKKPLEVLE